MSVDPEDFISRHVESDCCGAPILGENICSECREPCEVIDPDEEEENAPKPTPPAP